MFSNNKTILSGMVVAFAMTIFFDVTMYTELNKMEDEIGAYTSRCVTASVVHNPSCSGKHETIEHTHMKDVIYDSQEQIDEEIRLGEMELLAQLIEAEAGNQDFIGKCLVADVVLNRLEEGWGETLSDIIFMEDQFSCIKDGGFDKAGWHISQESFMAAKQEYEATVRMDEIILYFTAGHYNKYCKPMYVHGAHYFGG